MTPSRAFLTSGVSVLIFMPGPAGMAHDATGLGLFSTCIASERCRQKGADDTTGARGHGVMQGAEVCAPAGVKHPT